ncbi:VIT domain-containing protein [Lentzea flava]|uniref:Inter-alpha-trypsin inhibitor domain-containing protein n=1 Tax=Lentzea flava TaxID=103732 RepID=A0ABQ2UGX7_9PSEU|nr:VIT domain-containing protein [Lentzea flava]MCP2200965.1 Ca-activated chloride channel family protein [Lentzea flava]GGU27292.1 inter-alpha-trypsin inhibitor domain-containing protein [Lentzea flava]
MTFTVAPMKSAEEDRIGRTTEDAGVGALLTDRGNLPLESLDVRATITGLIGRVVLTTGFVNAHDTALEATYVFPLPDRAAVTGMKMTAGDRTVEAELQERGAARQAYDDAIAAGRRASIVEEERPDVFTMRVGNIPAGEHVTVELSLVGPLVYEDGAATFRFPLVVAPRYVPGTPLPGPSVGDGYAEDTDVVPDASRITPPVLLPGFPNPVRLGIGVEIDPAGLELGEVRSSLHTVSTEGTTVTVAPGERVDRDFVLRLAYAGNSTAAVCVPDPDDSDEGTYQLTVLPPDLATPVRPRDVVLLLDRSGSMSGWKMVAARRAAARIIDTLTNDDTFAVLTFDHQVERPAELGTGLVAATDRHRFRAVEHLAAVQARGGTELFEPLREGLTLLARASEERDPVLVLVTDGQVGNEDQLLRDIAPVINRTRVHAVGIDTAVNAGFLGRLAAQGAGRCELVESEDRLDEAMTHIQRRIGAPVITDLVVTPESSVPRQPSAIYPGVPLVAFGRYRGPVPESLTVRGRTRDGADWQENVVVRQLSEPAVRAQWARAALRDLEDRYAVGEKAVEPEIVRISLRFGVLCRFTAFVAVDERVVSDGTVHRVVQPVELPSGWEMPAPGFAAPMAVAGGGYGGPPPLAPAAPARFDAAVPLSARYTVTRGFQPAAPSLKVSGTATPGRPADLREITALEVQRLEKEAGRPTWERRDLLADLASRLGVLVASRQGPEYEPLRRLVADLTAGGDVDQLWARALQVLREFAAGKERRRSFWR